MPRPAHRATGAPWGILGCVCLVTHLPPAVFVVAEAPDGEHHGSRHHSHEETSSGAALAEQTQTEAQQELRKMIEQEERRIRDEKAVLAEAGLAEQKTEEVTSSRAAGAVLAEQRRTLEVTATGAAVVLAEHELRTKEEWMPKLYKANMMLREMLAEQERSKAEAKAEAEEPAEDGDKTANTDKLTGSAVEEGTHEKAADGALTVLVNSDGSIETPPEAADKGARWAWGEAKHTPFDKPTTANGASDEGAALAGEGATWLQGTVPEDHGLQTPIEAVVNAAKSIVSMLHLSFR